MKKSAGKILIINSFPQYMPVGADDMSYIEKESGYAAVVKSIADLSPDDIGKYSAAVSFNCVNIFHPEISKLSANSDNLQKVLADISKEGKIIYRRDRHFNGGELLPKCEFGRMLCSPKIKVLISVPVFERICKETLKSIYDLIIPENVEAEFNYQSGYTVAQARNRQAAESLAREYDYTLYVDSDIVLQPQLLVNLLDAGADLACGWYIKKIPNGPKITEIWKRKRFAPEEFEPVSEEELVNSSRGCRFVPIDGCGFGCVLLNNSVFGDLKEFAPIFFEFIEKKKADECFMSSEDLTFCMRLREKGKTMVCDPSLRCMHVGQYLY